MKANKYDLTEEVYYRLKSKEQKIHKKTIRMITDEFIEAISSFLIKVNDVVISNFGTLRAKNYKEIQQYAPFKKEIVTVKQRRIPKFIASKKLKEECTEMLNAERILKKIK